MIASDDRHVAFPPERFYWALLDASKVAGSRRAREEALSYLFEAQLPEPLEAVHAVYHDVGNGQMLACGIPKEVLRNEVAPAVVTLTPQTIPQFLGVEVDLAALNVLVGEFTPKSVRDVRRRLLWQATGLATACVALLVVGLERRCAVYESQQDEAGAATSQLYERALGYKSTGATLPPALQLQAELRVLRKTRVESPSTAPLRDAALALSQLCALWPRDAHAEVDSLQVTVSSLHVQGEVPANEDAQALASALANIPGFRAEIPSVHGSEAGVRFTLQWTADAKAGAR